MCTSPSSSYNRGEKEREKKIPVLSVVWMVVLTDDLSAARSAVSLVASMGIPRVALWAASMAGSLVRQLVVHWVELRAALSEARKVDTMDACWAAHSAAGWVALLEGPWVARSVESLVAWKDTSSATIQVI